MNWTNPDGFNPLHNMSNKKKHIIVIGGGNGSAIALQALKPFSDIVNLSAVISMSDAGGANGQLRKKFDMLPPSDVMRASLALSAYDPRMLKEVFYKNRISHVNDELDGHYLGNLFLFFAQRLGSSFEESLEAFHQIIKASGRAYPVTLEQSDLCVELSNGDIVIGEDKIDRPAYDRSLAIRRAWLQPTPPLYDKARQAIEAADDIIFGPGSLYTSIIPNVLVEGMSAAIRRSAARLLYISGNAYETNGETGPITLSGAIEALETYLPRPLDAIVYNSHMLSSAEKERYQSKHWRVLPYDRDQCKGRPVIEVDYEQPGGGLDPMRLGQALQTHFLS